MIGQPTFTDEIGSEPAGVDESANPSCPRRIDDILVLPHPIAVLIRCRNEQQPVRAGEGVAKAAGLPIVAVPNLYTAVGLIRGLGYIADGHGDIRRGHPLEQLINDQATELSGRGGYHDHDLLQSG